MQVVITGGSGGIGFAIAGHFAAQGHKVVIADLHQNAIDDKVAQLQAQGFTAAGIVLDVTDAASIANCAALYPADVLVNNAGIQHVARLEDFPPEKWQQLINVMLTGPAMLSRAMLPGMRSRNFGRIINIGSIHALVASPFKSAYVAAKHGLLGFSKVVALENADINFTINTVCPAYVKTPLVEQQIAAQAKEHNLTEQQVTEQIMLAPMPQKAFIGVDEIAATTAFLCTDAARHMTAQTLVLDGGWTAR
ncbi:3-hydroxybutyrate dehydrogenase [Rheinheimera sp.]|uniref:3-hydroxybutyrate dehydrogenase n=1 Tax=Rheinheimera sp. TaxID=1869214 RepID=UPI002734B0D7|nr:3-hydroxybutyrate dehydrogenase [Rheinheimera sp.]MDP2714589.1 3-hydroxybutyrate dehydrogenase [Rheinheimera sp.]